MSAPPLSPDTDIDQWIWESFYYHSRTFSLATRLLPGRVKMPIATLYMFCRKVDSVADQRVLEVGPSQALHEVRDIRRKLDDTLAGHPPSEAFWERLSEVHATFSLDRQPLYELIDGAIWDLEDRPIQDEDDLVDYSNLVGGSVGAMMLPFLLPSTDQRERLEAPARALGIGMQITNIVRDVGEDLRRLDRVYLPETLLREHGIDTADLRGESVPDAYPDLLETTMAIGEEHYRRSFPGIDALPFRMRIGIRSAARMYREIMNEVRANDYDNLTHRAYVTLPRKLVLILRDDYARRKRRLKDS